MAFDTSSTGYNIQQHAGVQSGMSRVATEQQTIGAQIVSAIVNPASSLTATQVLTGRDYASATNAIGQNVGALQSGQNANVNLTSGGAVAQRQENLGQLQASFRADVEGYQSTLRGALDQGADAIGMNADEKRQARNTFMPAPASSGAGLATDVALAAAGVPIIVSVAEEIGSTISDIKNDTKLSPVQEARLAAQMYAMLTPKRDMEGQIVEPAEIESPFSEQIENMGPEAFQDLLHEAFKPVEQQPEWAAMAALETSLDQTGAVHENREAVDHVAVAVERETGLELDARTASADLDVDRLEVVVASLKDDGFSGLRSTNALDTENEMAALKRRETQVAENIVAPPRAAVQQTLTI
jgi:hypothetical protein